MSGGTKVKYVENKYNDKWIKSWMRDAEDRGLTWDEQLQELEQELQDSAQQQSYETGLIRSELDAANVTAANLGEQVGGLRSDFDRQSAAFNFGLEGLEAARVGLDSATAGIDQRLAGQAAQVDAQLQLAQQGWANELAAAQAGWDTSQAAWQQQAADWENQFSQQQRAIDAQLVTEREEYEDQLDSIRDIYGVQREADRTTWEQQAATERDRFREQLATEFDLRAQLENQEWDTRIAEQEQIFASQQALAQQQAESERTLAEQQAEEQRRDFARQLAQYDTRSAEDKAAWDERYEAGVEEWDERYGMLEEEWQIRTVEQQAAFEQEAQERQAAFDEQTTQRQAEYDEQRAAFTGQIEQFQQQSQQRAQERAQEWEQRFAQSQESQRIQDAIQQRDLEAQLSDFGNQYQQEWATQSAAFKQDYEDLLGQATTDAERSRLEQAARFEQMQQDQAAAWNLQSQKLSEQDRVFGTQLDQLRSDLGIQTDMFGSAQRDFQEQQEFFNRTNTAEQARLQQSIAGLGQTSEIAREQLASQLGSDISSLGQGLSSDIEQVGMFGQLGRAALQASIDQGLGNVTAESAAARQQLASGLSSDIASLGQTSETARQQLASDLTGQQTALQESVTGQLGDFRQDIAEYKDTLAGQNAAQEEYYAANKRFREMQIQDAERARTAASYGSPGTTLNQQVKGVRRAGSSKPGGVIRSKSPRNVFNRSGLRISSLNI